MYQLLFMVDHMDYGELGRIEIEFIPGTLVGWYRQYDTFMIKGDKGEDRGTLSFRLEFQVRQQDFQSRVLQNAWAGRVRRCQPSSGSPGILPGSGPSRSPGIEDRAFPRIPHEPKEEPGGDVFHSMMGSCS